MEIFPLISKGFEVYQGKNLAGSSKPELGGFGQQVCVKGKGANHSLPLWGREQVQNMHLLAYL